ncbi:lactonase family protein [Paraburkholderia tropica]|uniref:lactonase family protein n=1 Tax=Paraburkholderia tropica TaxID=92647 RepID=UPI002AB64E70|nr:beta-propeller fold lactonase family protein [Paraburkholderia tropica]
MNSHASTGAAVVYVSCSVSREIHSFWLEPTRGTLRPIEVVRVPGSHQASTGNLPFVLHPSRDWLYVALRAPPYPLTTFGIDRASGKLSEHSTIQLEAPPAYLTVRPDGGALLGASYSAAILSVNLIDRGGVVRTPVWQTIRTPPKAHCVIGSRYHDLVYVTTIEGDAILTYRFDDSGRLTESTHLATHFRAGRGPRHLVLHPSLDVLYCLHELDGSVSTLTINRSSGALREVDAVSLRPSSFSGEAKAAEIRVTRNGRFLYASERRSHLLSAFSVDQNSGVLTLIDRYQVEASPRSFAISPDDLHLVCAGQDSDMVGVYSIDAENGRVSRLSQISVASKPNWVEIVRE